MVPAELAPLDPLELPVAPPVEPPPLVVEEAPVVLLAPPLAVVPVAAALVLPVAAGGVLLEQAVRAIAAAASIGRQTDMGNLEKAAILALGRARVEPLVRSAAEARRSALTGEGDTAFGQRDKGGA